MTLIRKDHALMLGILVIAVSIATVAVVTPIASFTAPFATESFNESLAVSDLVSSEKIPQQKTGIDGAGVTGWVKIQVLDSEGKIIAEREDHNLIVTKGLEVTSDLLFGTGHTTKIRIDGMR